jgi:hypothetical protein
MVRGWRKRIIVDKVIRLRLLALVTGDDDKVVLV